MRRLRRILLAALAAGAIPATAGAEDLKLEDLPPPVREAVEREVGDREITDIDPEIHAGRALIEVEYMDGDVQREIFLDQSGEIVKRGVE